MKTEETPTTPVVVEMQSTPSSEVSSSSSSTAPAAAAPYFRMALYASGIMLSLVIYGLLQERIMTRPYGDGIFFKSSAYLVLNNRIIAVLIALVLIKYKGETFRNQAPLYACAGVSVSNTIATFCQYDALKYVSFPTQTLGKCGKMIPVMTLGMLIGGKSYGWKEFLIAILVTIGCLTFVLTGDISSSVDRTDTAFGLFLMGGYLFSDGFTSTLQEKLFRGYEMSTYNQMLYVNLCSGFFSVLTLIFNGELISSFAFSFTYSTFFFNALLLSFASSLGQLIILWTIKEFGALFFATVMTVRQVVSMILSSVIYLHPLTVGQWISAALVFLALYYKDTQMRKPHGHSHPPKSSLPVDKPVVVDLKNELK